MKRFTDSIRESVHNANWFGALFLALCLPDICGAVETPTEAVGNRYKRWFEENLGQEYGTLFTADDCYFFRCACLHQGLDTHQRLASERIHFIVPPPRESRIHRNMLNDVLQMQIDIFCIDIADAVDSWYESIAKKDPSMEAEIAKLIQIYGYESLAPFIRFS